MAKQSKDSLPKKVADNTSKGAMAATLNTLFEDMYAHRWQIYRMNFVRGIMVGFGGVIGATIVVAILLWTMSLFNHVPLIGDFVNSAKQSIEKSKGSEAQ